MKIVIDILEQDYERVVHDDRIPVARMRSAIRNGTPLPKQHGRLIDADAYMTFLEEVSKRQKYKELPIDAYLTVDDVLKAVIESLQNEGLAEGDAPTIIESEREG